MSVWQMETSVHEEQWWTLVIFKYFVDVHKRILLSLTFPLISRKNMVFLSYRCIYFARAKVIPPGAHKGIYDGKGLMFGNKPTFSEKK